jgi:hypothetical protein
LQQFQRGSFWCKNKKRVLILTEQFDPTADFLIEELDRRGANFLRLDTGDFLEKWSIAALDGPVEWLGGIYLQDGEISLSRHP